MTTATKVSPTLREPQLLGQTVVVIGGSSGIGLETADEQARRNLDQHLWLPLHVARNLAAKVRPE